VRADPAQPSAVEPCDEVAARRGAEPVSDDHGGATRALLGDDLADVHPRRGVEARHRVEDEDPGRPGERSREAESLQLPARERGVAEGMAYSCERCRDEVAGAGGHRPGLDLGAAGDQRPLMIFYGLRPSWREAT
jgi:hypothetical protein